MIRAIRRLMILVAAGVLAAPSTAHAAAAADGPSVGVTLFTRGVQSSGGTASAFVQRLNPDGTTSTVTAGSLLSSTPDLSRLLVRRGSETVVVDRSSGSSHRLGRVTDAVLIPDGVAVLPSVGAQVQIRSADGRRLVRTLPQVWRGEKTTEIQVSPDGQYLYQGLPLAVSPYRTEVLLRPLTTGGVWRRYPFPTSAPVDGCQWRASRVELLELHTSCMSHMENGPGGLYFKDNVTLGTDAAGTVVSRGLPYNGYLETGTDPQVIQRSEGNVIEPFWDSLRIGEQVVENARLTGWTSTMVFFRTRGELHQRELTSGADRVIGQVGSDAITMDGTWQPEADQW